MKEAKSLIMVAVMLIGSILIAGTAIGDDDYHEHEDGNIFKRKLDVAPVANDLYAKECGSCHFAYQPALLPARSWDKLMNTLDNHFGDNAELLPEDHKAIAEYLASNSAERSGYKTSMKIARSIPAGATPIAITETPYFMRKHDEIPARLVKGNPGVKSFSHCDRCHTNAVKGSFEEREVNIPGYGRYDD